MKHTQTPPPDRSEIDIDSIVPADFPVPDDVLDMIDDAVAAPDAAFDEHAIALQYCGTAYHARFATCQDLARQLCALIRERGQAFPSQAEQRHVLVRYRSALALSGWTSLEEAYWVTHRMALWLGWHGAVARTRGPVH